MKKLIRNKAGYIDPLMAFLAGAGVVVAVVVLFNINFFGASTPDKTTTDVINFISTQHDKIEEMNKTISNLNQEIDELKSNDYYKKYNDLDERHTRDLVISSAFLTVLYFILAIILYVVLNRKAKQEKKSYEESKEQFETERRQLKADVEKEIASDLTLLKDRIKNLETDLKIKDKEHEIECIKCKNES